MEQKTTKMERIKALHGRVCYLNAAPLWINTDSVIKGKLSISTRPEGGDTWIAFCSDEEALDGGVVQDRLGYPYSWLIVSTYVLSTCKIDYLEASLYMKYVTLCSPIDENELGITLKDYILRDGLTLYDILNMY